MSRSIRAWERFYAGLEDGYRAALAWSLRRRWAPLLITSLLLVSVVLNLLVHVLRR